MEEPKFKIGDFVIGITWAKRYGEMQIISIVNNMYVCKPLMKSPYYEKVYQNFPECRKVSKLDRVLK